MKFDITKLDEKDTFVEIPFGNQDEQLKIKKFLSSGDISWLSSEYVNDYLKGLSLIEGGLLTEKIGQDLFNPQLAYRQFLVNLTGLVTDLELDTETINAFEARGLFNVIYDNVENPYIPLDNAREVIDRELSVGVVVQNALAKVLSLIPEDAKIESLTENFAKAINGIDKDRLAFLGEMFKENKTKI